MDQTLLIILIVIGISLALTTLALTDILKKDFGSLKTKLIWHFIALVPFLGWMIYLVFGYRKGRRPKPP